MRTPRLTVIAVALAAVLVPLGLVSTAGAVSARQTAAYPFQNPQLPLKVRLADLMGRLTLDEKISLLHQYEPAIPRLGIKAFKTGPGRAARSSARPPPSPTAARSSTRSTGATASSPCARPPTASTSTSRTAAS